MAIPRTGLAWVNLVCLLLILIAFECTNIWWPANACVTGVRRGECRAVAAVHGAVVGARGKVGQGRCLPLMLGAGTGALVMGSTRDERLRRGEAAVWGAGPLAVR